MTVNSAENVLLSPIGGQAMYGIVKYFRDKGNVIIGMDKDPEAACRHFVDKFFTVPDVSDPAYMDSVLGIIRQNAVNRFISWLNPEIIFWNDRFYASEISDELVNIFGFNFRKDLMSFCDKFKFDSLLAGKGFDYPKTALLGEYEKQKIGLPAIIKPRIGFGAKDTYTVDNGEAMGYFRSFLKAKFGDIKKFVIQEFIDGDEYTVDFFAVKGKVINAVVRKRIRHRGVSLVGEVVHVEAIEKVVYSFCSAFGINGLNNIQVMGSNDKFYILDFNPRPSGTIMLSISSGVDLLNNLFEKMEGGNITAYGKPRNLKMIRHLCEFFYE